MRTKIQEPNGGLRFTIGIRKLEDQEDSGFDGWQGGCSCGFRTSGWPTRAIAEERIGQHAMEHETAGTDEQYTTPELVDYKESIGFDVNVNEPPSQDPFGNDGLGAADDDEMRSDDQR